LKLRVHGLAFVVKGLERRIQGLEFRAQNLGIRVFGGKGQVFRIQDVVRMV
jgi:hypothetical protein